MHERIERKKGAANRIQRKRKRLKEEVLKPAEPRPEESMQNHAATEKVWSNPIPEANGMNKYQEKGSLYRREDGSAAFKRKTWKIRKKGAQKKEKKLNIPLEIRRKASRMFVEALGNEEGPTVQNLLPILTLLVFNSEFVKQKLYNLLNSPPVQKAISEGIRSLFNSADSPPTPIQAPGSPETTDSSGTGELIAKLKSLAEDHTEENSNSSGR